MEWNFLLSLTNIVLDVLDTIIGINSDVAYALWFIRQWTLCGLLLSVFECCIAWYILKVVIQRMVLLNDELLSMWSKVTNVVVSFFVTVVQSKTKLFAHNVIGYSTDRSPSIAINSVIGTNTR